MHLNTVRLLPQSFHPGPHLTCGPCHLLPPSEISRSTAVERLWAVQQTLEASGSTPVADAPLTELSTVGRTSIGVGKRTERFFREGEALKVLYAITSHPKYSNTELLKNDDLWRMSGDSSLH